MDEKFQSIPVSDFLKKFGTHEQCIQHLADLKWKDGFACSNCSHTKSCKAKRAYDKQCSRCRYIQSPTSNTLFHKVKFSLEKAFLIIYFISTNKKGISSTELIRKTGLPQNTAWLFRIKVLQAMESSDRHPLEGNVEIKKIMMAVESMMKDGTKKMVKKDVLIAIEKKSGGIARMYSRVIAHNSKAEFQKFVKSKIAKDSKIKSCKWCSSNSESLRNDYQIENSDEAKKEMPLLNRMKTGLEAWLKGMHGKVQYIQFYLNEYCYRHNRHLMNGEILDDLIDRMMKHKPRPYKDIIA